MKLVHFGLTFHFVLPHSGAGAVTSSFSPDPYNSMFLPTNSLLMHSWISVQRAAAKTIELYPLPACRVYLRDGTGYITSHELHLAGLPIDWPFMYSLIII
jgi:hypothetical protein